MSGLSQILGFGERAKRAAEVPRSQIKEIAFERVGLVAVVLGIVAFYGVFSTYNPWQTGFELNAVFKNSVHTRIGSPVRIAGVDVGTVEGVSRTDGTDFSTMKMTLEDKGLPVKNDARLKIRPRNFLEGSNFIDLKPGTPSAPELKSGGTIPVTQTATAVQFDEFLTALQADTRESLKETLAGLAEGLDGTGEAEEELTASAGEEEGDTDEDVSTTDASGVEQEGKDERSDTAAEAENKEPSGAEELNKIFKNLPSTLKSTEQVSGALLGQQPGELSRLMLGLQRTVTALDRNEPELQSLVTNFNVTVAALASESAALSAAIGELPDTVIQARTTLGHLNSSLPATNAFAREVRPGVREIPATLEASPEWLKQVGALVQEDELGGVLANLSPTVRDLASVVGDADTLLDELDLFSRCATDVLVPTFSQPINDPPHSTGVEPYKELFYTFVGVSSAAQNFDGNGLLLSADASGGDTTVSAGKINGVGGELFANVTPNAIPQGSRPKPANRRPPYGPEKACKKQKRPDLNSAQTGPALPVVASGTAFGAGSLSAENDDTGGGDLGDLDDDLLGGDEGP